jgi:hypothetical protein
MEFENRMKEGKRVQGMARCQLTIGFLFARCLEAIGFLAS